MKNYTMFVLFVAAAVLFAGCTKQPKSEKQQLKEFIDNHVAKLKPLARQANLTSWQAETTGDEAAYEKLSELQYKIRRMHADEEDFAFLKQLKQSGKITDPLLARQLDVLYRSFLSNQIEPALLRQIVDTATAIQKEFNRFRGTIGGQKVTNNEILDILKTAADPQRRRAAWQASKQVGPAIAGQLVRLVQLRNQAARKLGFDNYHTLSLTTAEQDVEQLDRIFNRLYELTNEPFREVKGRLDVQLAAKYDLESAELMPWHYHDPFFQETPMVYDLDLDRFYRDRDVKALAQKFFAGIGLDVTDILTASDLYEREGKCPHAFCTDIDRAGDVRILCNLKNNESWMETILHELGHGVYDKYINRDLPWLLRTPAHSFTTEAVAMLSGRLSRNPAWMQQMLGLTDAEGGRIEEVAQKYMRLKQLIFVRWAMVMYNFEKALYADPEQDLNSLWWRLVEKYQFVNPPAGRNEPDWAAKIHFTAAPCYYHNYVLGELLASQLHHRIVTDVLELPAGASVGYVGQEPVGDFLRKEVFQLGDMYHWNLMIEKATGEPLTPEYFVEQFVN